MGGQGCPEADVDVCHNQPVETFHDGRRQSFGTATVMIVPN